MGNTASASRNNELLVRDGLEALDEVDQGLQVVGLHVGCKFGIKVFNPSISVSPHGDTSIEKGR